MYISSINFNYIFRSIKSLEVIVKSLKCIDNIIVLYSDIWYNESTVGAISVYTIKNDDSRPCRDFSVRFLVIAIMGITKICYYANIVLGADADEIIVANQDGIDSAKKSRRFEYRSGSIENNLPVYKLNGTLDEGVLNARGIQQHICDILEGGITAFEKRKNKYHI